jgi:demethylmenaquinone methyltransferase/2-methoxy-6-polyprenyl-1,4-benzoquinol methylase
MNTDIISYYKDRAKEYEKIYTKPERQRDLLLAEKILQDIFRNKEVFEIACGTGYWTNIISKTASSILATDINETVLDIARSKDYFTKVDFQKADIFSLPKNAKHQSLFGGFIWSHIQLQKLDHFIDIANSLVEPGGVLVFIDNNFVEGSSLPLTSRDEYGNTYQTRQLENGTTHKVLKNFPPEDFIHNIMSDKLAEPEVIRLEYYWILKYKVVMDS